MTYTPWPQPQGTLHDLEKTVRKVTKELRPNTDHFDSIVVTGISGLVVGSPVSLRLKVPLVIIRKPYTSENAHSYGHVNIEKAGDRYLFLDDFKSSGETERRVQEAMAANTKAFHVGTLFYTWDRGIEWNPEPPKDWSKEFGPAPSVKVLPDGTLEPAVPWPAIPANLKVQLVSTFEAAGVRMPTFDVEKAT